MYGHEESYAPATEIFTKEDAEEALSMTKETFKVANRLIMKPIDNCYSVNNIKNLINIILSN